MARECQYTGKRTTVGNKYTLRGIAKKKKGIGIKVTGITRRRFLPNLFKKRFWFAEENRFVTLRLSAAAIRSIDKLGIETVIRQIRASGQKI